MTTRIGIVLGSASDVERMQKGLDRLEQMDVPFEFCIASAHRTPERLARWLSGAEERGIRVIIAGAGAAAHLPGVVASKTLLPVIGVPFDASPLSGVDALYSIVQMPPGIPVATVGVNSPENAVVLALHIIATAEPEIREKLRRFREGWQQKIARQNEELYVRFPNARPPLDDPPSVDIDAAAQEESGRETSGDAPPPETAAKASGSRQSNIRFVDAQDPALGIIEEAVDVLIDGGVVAIPTDTVYGLVVDATNPQAVQRLYDLKGRDRDKPLPVLIDTMKMFEGLARPIAPEALELLRECWPGALTVVAPRRPAVLKSVTQGETIGLRMPDHYVALSLISMAARPLASSSANPSSQPEATTAEEVSNRFGSDIGLILDTGQPGSGASSTILSVAGETFQVLRQGEISEESLRSMLGDRLP